MGENTNSIVNISVVSEVKDSLSGAVDSFSANVPICKNYSIFKSLADAGFDTACCSTYDDNIATLAKKLSALVGSMDSYINTTIGMDEKIEEEIPDEDSVDETLPDETPQEDVPPAETGNDGLDENTDIGSGENTDGSSGDLTDPQATTPTTEPPKLKKPNNKPDMKKVYDEFEKYYKKMSSKNLTSIMSSIYDEAAKKGITINELLSSDKYDSVILTLINNKALSPEMRERMKELGVDVSRKLLKDFLIGDRSVIGYNDKTKKYIYDALGQVANASGKTADNIISSKDGSLRESLSFIQKKLEENKTNLKLLDVLLGFDDNKIAEILKKWKK